MNAKNWTRRKLFGTAGMGAAALAAGALAGACTRTRRAPAGSPNVLFISIDDLNDWVGVLGGHPQVKTPHIDALAGRGMLFTNAHSAGTACNTSRTAVLTGMRPSTSGIYDNKVPFRESPVLKDAVTMHQHFMQQGYKVLSVGKVFHMELEEGSAHLSWMPPRRTLRPRLPESARGDGQPDELFKGNFRAGPVGVDREMYDWMVSDWAIRHLREMSGGEDARPFFLACGFRRPHRPRRVPQAYFDLYPTDVALPAVRADDLDDLPAAWKAKIERSIGMKRSLRLISEPALWHAEVRAYLASVSFVDFCIGRLLSALNDLGRSSERVQNTYIVLWSDQGVHLGEKRLWAKGTLWEETTRIPLIISGPGVKAHESHEPASLIQLYPTLVELCGLSTPELNGQSQLDGTSLAGFMAAPEGKRLPPVLTTRQRGQHAVRSEHWRYIRYADGAEELYDHREDPNEWNNLAGLPDHAAVKRDLARYLPQHDAPTIGKTADDDEDEDD